MADGCAEAGEEGVEWLYCINTHVSAQNASSKDASSNEQLIKCDVDMSDGTYIISTNDSIEKLDTADEDEEGHEDVEEEGARRCGLQVLIPDMQGDVLRAGFGGEA